MKKKMPLASSSEWTIPHLLKTIALTIVYAIILLFSMWSVSFGFISGIISLFLLAVGLSWGLRRKSNAVLSLVPLIWLVVNAALSINTITTFNEQIATYTRRLGDEGDLSVREKANIYGLNLFMSLTAFPVYPEASLESFLLAFPTRDGTRKFKNAFFLHSERIRNALSTHELGKDVLVRWKPEEYSLGNSEARYALALNPCSIRKTQSGPDTIFEAKVRVEYPMKSQVTLIETPFEITMEEGLFGYLQKCGWLHPYTAIWTARKSSR